MPCMPAITLTHPTAGPGSTPLAVQLPSNLLWVDQYTWNRVEATRQYSSTGALVIDQWTRQAGRPITLQGTQERAWCERGLLTTLRGWADQAALQLSLTHGSDSYQVAFDHQQAAIDAEPLPDMLGAPSRYTVRDSLGQVITDVDVDYFSPQATDPFQVTLRLLVL